MPTETIPPTSAPDFNVLIDDLRAEQVALDQVVAGLTPEQWNIPTPADRWRVRDQIQHLTRFDALAALAITDEHTFVRERDALLADADFEEHELEAAAATTWETLLEDWRRARGDLQHALQPLDPSTRITWFGPSMSARSHATARLMEAWAHGEDVAATVGVTRPATDRLRHVVHLGVITREWSYRVRGSTPPDASVRVEIEAPSGALWTWGPEEAADRIAGAALDFALVVTQRTPVRATGLEVDGDAAESWMSVAQCFAGRPTLVSETRQGSTA